MLDAMLILSFAMCLFCCIRSLWKDGWGYAIAGAMFALVALLAILLYRMPTSALVSLERMI